MGLASFNRMRREAAAKTKSAEVAKAPIVEAVKKVVKKVVRKPKVQED